jgi:ElaB/YqjD/DUF883 family membrane-anchored ribosome-binding protein
MAEDSKDTHPDELRSDLDLLVEMANDLKKNGQFIDRHLDSLKQKLDGFVHRKKAESGGGSAS